LQEIEPEVVGDMQKMIINKVTCDQARLKECLLPKLRETVFHVTSGEGLEGILEEKMILPNTTNRRFNYSYPQSANSFGVKRKYICLFDLRDKSNEIIDETLLKFYFLNHNVWEKNILLIINPNMYGDLIQNDAAKKEIGFSEMWIPNV
jgi:hypothetical protein